MAVAGPACSLYEYEFDEGACQQRHMGAPLRPWFLPTGMQSTAANAHSAVPVSCFRAASVEYSVCQRLRQVYLDLSKVLTVTVTHLGLPSSSQMHHLLPLHGFRFPDTPSCRKLIRNDCLAETKTWWQDALLMPCRQDVSLNIS